MINKSSLIQITAILFFSIVCFTKCYTPSYKKELKGLDSLHKALVTSQQEIRKVDTNKINISYKMFLVNNNKLKSLTTKLQDDDKTLIEDYDTYGNSFFKQYMIQYVKLDNELKYSLNQLDSLKADLLGGRLPKSAFDNYFRTEKLAANNLNSSVSVFTGYVKNYEKKFDELNPKIKELLGRK